MNSPEEYLKQTESAVVKIFEGIDSYLKILPDSPPVYIGNAGDTLNQSPAYKNWIAENAPAIQSSLKAQREFSAESFALATLCGSVLQIAAMGIQWFSKNKEISEALPEALHPLVQSGKTGKIPIEFCIGRKVRSVPIGLLIYAGRNQYNHMDMNEKLKPLNTTIFNLLAISYEGAIEQSSEDLVFNLENYEDAEEQSFEDPAFNLKNTVLINFSSNITALLEWRNYESYYADMNSLIIV